MVSVFDVANAFIKKGIDQGRPITHMQLQKLLYYAQGYNLAIHNKRLFPGVFNKWSYGPVNTQIYSRLRNQGASPIAKELTGAITLDSSAQKLVDAVWRKYGNYSGSQLSNMSHDEDPWLKTPDNDVISDNHLKAFFADKLKSAV